MESSESHEPSYYEVALTNRQVLIAFVALLVCLVVAFLSGVWIGRGEAPRQATLPASLEATQAKEPPLERLSFFNGAEAGARGATPPATAAAEPVPVSAPAREDASAGEAMRQNLEATIAANREPSPGAAVGKRYEVAPQEAAAAPAKPAAAPAKPAATEASSAASAPSTAKTPTASAAVAGRFFVQVYSSSNGARAREIVAQLRKSGFTVQLAEAPVGGATNFRVRVGPFDNRAKADSAASRLRREHRLDTWITDTP